MPLRHEISESRFNIKASEIEVVEPIVIKQLLRTSISPYNVLVIRGS